MDTSDPLIVFDAQGICNYCHEYRDTAASRLADPIKSQKLLDELLTKVRRSGAKNDFDCLVGVSGGVDSSYVAYLAKKWGLRPLAFHFDSGWNSELAVGNIQRLLEKLDIPLHTFVCDWEEMKSLQVAYLRSGMVNCDIPQDHSIIASLYATAAKFKIQHILVGTNVVTEAILPESYRGHRCTDLRSLRAVFKRFGQGRLNRYPTIGILKRYFYYRWIHPVYQHGVLNLIDYNKAEAKDFLTREFGWRDYGGKHFESVYTRFHQGYYLPKKFGYDKRRCHLSTLILSGQITRDSALDEMGRPPYPEDALARERDFVLQKLEISREEFETVMKTPLRDYRELPNEDFVQSMINRVGKFIRKFQPHRQI